jgi:site-specific DNA-methyltransferase (adenine-specific)
MAMETKTPSSVVYMEDCVEAMKRYPDKYFDLAVVDPPYGLGAKLVTGGTWASKYDQNDAKWDKAPSDEYFLELFRISKNQVIWGGNYFSLAKTRCFLIWNKIPHLNTMSDCEYAWTSFDRNAKLFNHARNTKESRIHICQKPVKLYEWILHLFSNSGDKILDTHLGSGSSRIAAYKTGLDFVGFEIDEEYYQKQEERFNLFLAQSRLF